MPREIPLTRDRVAIVDDEDFEQVSQHRWHALGAGSGRAHVYAVRTVTSEGRRRMIYMHRYLLGVSATVHLDHINGDTLDNRRSNLRQATQHQNTFNMAPRRNTTSEFKGVCLRRCRVKGHVYEYWLAKIKVNGKSQYLCTTKSEIKAAQAYDVAARRYFGEFARTNF